MAVRLHTAAPFRTQASSALKSKEGAGGLVCKVKLVPLVRACFCMVAEQLPIQGSC